MTIENVFLSFTAISRRHLVNTVVVPLVAAYMSLEYAMKNNNDHRNRRNLLKSAIDLYLPAIDQDPLVDKLNKAYRRSTPSMRNVPGGGIAPTDENEILGVHSEIDARAVTEAKLIPIEHEKKREDNRGINRLFAFFGGKKRK